MALNKNNIAIIGHGPSTRGRRLGSFIDLCDTVIRMIECDWQDAEDYGSKYTVGIYATGGSDDYINISKRKPSLCWWAYETLRAMPSTLMEEDTVDIKGFSGKPIRWLRRTVWDWVGSNRKFSRGTAAAIAAMSIMEPTTIYLVGFDDVARGGMLKGAYHPPELQKYLKEHRKTLYRSETDHNWENEGLVIQRAANHYDVEVNFV